MSQVTWLLILWHNAANADWPPTVNMNNSTEAECLQSLAYFASHPEHLQGVEHISCVGSNGTIHDIRVAPSVQRVRYRPKRP